MSAQRTEWTEKELMAVFIARQIRDGEFVNIGTNLPVPRAGALLAHFTRCPNLRLGIGGGVVTNLIHQPRAGAFQFGGDPRSQVGAEGFLPGDLSHVRRIDLFFTGGMQVDQYGNCNLIGVGKDYPRLRFRGPGAVGAPSSAAYAKRCFISVTAHNPRVLVPRCDYISCFGWGEGGADARQRLGLPGGGPEFVITPLCIMDFEPQSKRLRLKHVFQSTAEILSRTGFEPIVPANIEPLEPPTPEELHVLRTRVDPEGMLRGERE